MSLLKTINTERTEISPTKIKKIAIMKKVKCVTYVKKNLIINI